MDGFNLTNFIGLGDVQLLHLWLLLFNSAPYSLVELFVAQVTVQRNNKIAVCETAADISR